MSSQPSPFVVSVHDVSPVFRRQVDTILDALNPLVGSRLSAAVVPDWHGSGAGEREAEFWPGVRDRADEIVLHGYHHHQSRPGVWTTLTAGANEFTGLKPTEVALRLRRGQRALRRIFGASARGFLPPAFQPGAARGSVLSEAGIDFSVGMWRLAAGHRSRPLVTRAWDWGPLPGATFVGEWLARARGYIRSGAIPVVTLHPRDVDRRHLPRAGRLVRRLLRSGARPRLFGELIP